MDSNPDDVTEETYGLDTRVEAESMVDVACGCGDYRVRVPRGNGPEVIDVVCPECGNHFGYDNGEPADGTINRATGEMYLETWDEWVPLEAVERMIEDVDELERQGTWEPWEDE